VTVTASPLRARGLPVRSAYGIAAKGRPILPTIPSERLTPTPRAGMDGASGSTVMFLQSDTALRLAGADMWRR